MYSGTDTLLRDTDKTLICNFISNNWEEFIHKIDKESFLKTEKSRLPVHNPAASDNFEVIIPSQNVIELPINEVSFETYRISEVCIAKQFTVIAPIHESVNLNDLTKKEVQIQLIPPKLIKKLKSILKDLQKLEPQLYKSLLKTNNKVDVDEIISFLEFVGAESLPKGFDIKSLFDELKLLPPDGT
jgi:hypothetical protein